jgi:hypothetical protein
MVKFLQETLKLKKKCKDFSQITIQFILGNMAKQIKKKSPAGRKPVEDKKVTVCLYVRQSLLDEKGGKEEVQKLCYEFLGVSTK